MKKQLYKMIYKVHFPLDKLFTLYRTVGLFGLYTMSATKAISWLIEQWEHSIIQHEAVSSIFIIYKKQQHKNSQIKVKTNIADCMISDSMSAGLLNSYTVPSSQYKVSKTLLSQHSSSVLQLFKEIPSLERSKATTLPHLVTKILKQYSQYTDKHFKVVQPSTGSVCPRYQAQCPCIPHICVPGIKHWVSMSQVSSTGSVCPRY